MSLRTQNDEHLGQPPVGISPADPAPLDPPASKAEVSSPTIDNSSYDDPADDIEKSTPGWPQLAWLMSKVPEFDSFEAFSDLHIKSILYYQAELVELRKELHKREWKDFRSADSSDRGDTRRYASRIDCLLESRDSNSAKARRQWECIQRIRWVLKEYNKALLQYSQAASLPRADKSNVERFRKWVKRAIHNTPSSNGGISGEGSQTWGPLWDEPESRKPLLSQFLNLVLGLIWTPQYQENESDLIVPLTGRTIDPLAHSAFQLFEFWTTLLNAFGRKRTPLEADLEAGRRTLRRSSTFGTITRLDTQDDQPKFVLKEQYDLIIYSRRIAAVRSAITTLTACLLPTAAIAILSSLHRTATLIGVLGALTVVFAIGLMFFTSSKPSRVEIFSATAA